MDVTLQWFVSLIQSIVVERKGRLVCDCRGQDDMAVQGSLETDKNRITDLILEASECVDVA